MGLLERLKDGPRRELGGPCMFAKVLTDMPEPECAEVERIMDSIAGLEGKYSATWLSRELTREGFPVNHASILRHARKECRCYANR